MDKMLAAIEGLSESMERIKMEMKGDAHEVEGAVSAISSKMDMSVQHLKEEIGQEELQRKRDNGALETRIEAHIDSERRKVQDELAFVKGEEKNIQVGKQVYCDLCRQHWRLDSDLAHMPGRLLWHRGVDTWVPIKLQFKRWVPELSLKHIQGIQHDQVRAVLEEIEKMMLKEATEWIDWALTEESQGPWPRKTMVSLLFVHGTGKLMMVEILKMMRQGVENKYYKVNGATDCEDEFGIESSKETFGQGSGDVLQGL